MFYSLLLFAIGLFTILYVIYPLLLIIKLKLKHGKECTTSFFPVIGGVFIGIIRDIKYKNAFADTEIRL